MEKSIWYFTVIWNHSAYSELKCRKMLARYLFDKIAFKGLSHEWSSRLSHSFGATPESMALSTLREDFRFQSHTDLRKGEALTQLHLKNLQVFVCHTAYFQKHHICCD
jgi:hypothetical protein